MSEIIPPSGVVSQQKTTDLPVDPGAPILVDNQARKTLENKAFQQVDAAPVWPPSDEPEVKEEKEKEQAPQKEEAPGLVSFSSGCVANGPIDHFGEQLLACIEYDDSCNRNQVEKDSAFQSSPSPNSPVCRKSESKEAEPKRGDPVYRDGKGNPVAINEPGVAEWFGMHFKIIRVPVEGRFYIYEEKTGLYRAVTDDHVICLLKDVFWKMLEGSNALNLFKKRSQKCLLSCVKLLMGVVERHDVFKRPNGLIHVANGMIKSKCDEQLKWSFELLPFSPEYYSRDRVEIVYDPNAECPNFLEKLIKPAFSDKNDVVVLQKYIGQCLFGKNKSQHILVIQGVAGRGKTTIVSILAHLLGRHNVGELRELHFDRPFEGTSYQGKKLLVMEEASADVFARKRPRLKGLVGGSLFTQEQKNKDDRIDDDGHYNVLIVANSIGRIHAEGDGEAWARRLIILNVDGDDLRPEDRKEDYAEKLIEDEGSGILNWALEGWLLRQKDLSSGKGTYIPITPEQERRVRSRLAMSDPVLCFIKGQIVKAPGSNLTTQEIKAAFEDYCKDQNCEFVKPTSSDIERYMKRCHGVEKVKSIKRDEKDEKGKTKPVDKEGYNRVSFKLPSDDYDTSVARC